MRPRLLLMMPRRTALNERLETVVEIWRYFPANTAACRRFCSLSRRRSLRALWDAVPCLQSVM